MVVQEDGLHIYRWKEKSFDENETITGLHISLLESQSSLVLQLSSGKMKLPLRKCKFNFPDGTLLGNNC